MANFEFKVESTKHEQERDQLFQFDQKIYHNCRIKFFHLIDVYSVQITNFKYHFNLL
jgi:hypothetical protein